MTYLEERVVGPSLGADSIRAGVISSIVGLLLIMLFMLWYYKLSGVNAIVALVFNLVILIGLMAYIGATMTLPGIAGFVLTMGVGVDSNVLIFERIKEELAAQHGVRAVDQRRLQPRVPDAARHAHRVADLGGVPLPVRHGPDPRVRHHAVDRSVRQPVHVDLRVEGHLRDGDVGTSDAGAEHLTWQRSDVQRIGHSACALDIRFVAAKSCTFSRIPTTTSSAGSGTRSPCRGSSSWRAPW